MEIHSWENSPLASMTVKQGLKGPEAVLVPAEGVGAGKLMHIPDAMRKEGMTAEPILAEGNKPALRIRGFENSEQVTAVLEKQGMGAPSKSQTIDTSAMSKPVAAQADMAAAPPAKPQPARTR